MERKTHTIDVTGKILGRVATDVSVKLRGKDVATYEPHKDEGAIVVIQNVDKMKFTGKKLTGKLFKHHTGYIGHLKETKLIDLYNKNPEEVFRKAVYNMLPKNKLRAGMMKRLRFEK